MPLTLRRLSQLLALALAALTWWVMVSRPGVIDPDFSVEIHAALAAVAALVFGLSFVALRFATGGSAVYWSMESEDQLRPIGWLILAVLGVILGISAGLHTLGRAAPASDEVTYLLAGTLVPAAFLHFRLITWPSRSSYSGRLKLFLIGGLAIGLAAVYSQAVYSLSPYTSGLPPIHELTVAVGAVIVGATFEEILFRVLLLTALLNRTGSRFQAVFLSSVAFGMMHVPGVLADPLMHGDWAFFQQVAFDYAPRFLIQTFMGLVLGVFWLRTGSITLIAATHAILNLGAVMAGGFLA